MKKKALLLALILALGALAGCGKEAAGPGENPYGLQTVREGYLTVATSPDYAPFEFYTLDQEGNATLAGFDMDLAQYLADKLGLTLELVPMDFDGTITELGAGRCDLSMAGYSPDPDRLTYMDFSDVYYTGSQVLVTTLDQKVLVPDLESANDPKISIGVQVGSVQANLARELTPDAQILELAKVTDVIAELVSGKINAAFLESPVLEAYTSNFPQLQAVCPVPYEADAYVLGVAKGNGALLARVNSALHQALEDGTFDGFVAKAVEQSAGDIYEGLLEETGLISAAGFQKTFRYAGMFAEGTVTTVTLSALTVFFGFFLALGIAVLRLSSLKPLRLVGTVYVEVFRATPMLVQLFLVNYVLFAGVELPQLRLFGFIRFERMIPGVCALCLNSGAYLGEIIRSGIQSVDPGQMEAARSLGLTRFQAMKEIILPQALKNILPAIANEFVTIIKESSICYTIGVQEIMSAVTGVKAATFTIAEPLLVAAAIYFCLTYPTSKLIAYFERRLRRADNR